MKVKYLGPATTLTVDGKVYHQGDVVDLSEEQLAVMSTVHPDPTKNRRGIHRFEMSDSQQERVTKAIRQQEDKES